VLRVQLVATATVAVVAISRDASEVGKLKGSTCKLAVPLEKNGIVSWLLLLLLLLLVEMLAFCTNSLVGHRQLPRIRLSACM